jgi:hypothetical protein
MNKQSSIRIRNGFSGNLLLTVDPVFTGKMQCYGLMIEGRAL